MSCADPRFLHLGHTYETVLGHRHLLLHVLGYDAIGGFNLRQLIRHLLGKDIKPMQ